MLETVTNYSRLTHPDPRCVLACCVEATVIADIINGKLKGEDDLNAVIEECYQWVLENYHPDPEADGKRQYLERTEFERYCYASSWSSLELDDSQKIGYVYKCLGAGLFSLRLGLGHKTSPASAVFEDVVTTLVMQGGDADTNACCAGAMLGAWLGYELLPPHWRDGIKHSDWLIQKTNAMCQLAGIVEKTGYDGLKDPDTMRDEERGLLTREQLDEREKALWVRLCDKDRLRREKEQALEAKSKRKKLWRIFSR
jgi:ADP-ribosylglycohydrolase